MTQNNHIGYRRQYEEECSRAYVLSWLVTPCTHLETHDRMGNGRTRRVLILVLGVITVLLGSVLVWYPAPDLSAELEIVHKIAELSEKLSHANALNLSLIHI